MARRAADDSGESDESSPPARSPDDADPTAGGALPDPNDDSPRGRFNRGEIDAAELSRLLNESG